MSAKTLFATHYHELTELEGRFDGVKNYCISVKESGDDITFLRKIIRGGANRSYGIQVAKLAGIPKAVIQRAKEILEDLEAHDINNNVNSMVKKEYKNEVIKAQVPPWVTSIKDIDVLRLSPIEAMNVLNELVEKAKEEDKQ
jgi:DNA mismatch repair protein MutS